MITSLRAVKDPLIPQATRYFGSAKKPAKKKSNKPAPPLETPIDGAAPAVEIPEHREEIQAPYHFTPGEVAQMNVDHRTALDSIELLQDQQKAAVQDFKLRIQNKRNEERMLRTKLTSGEESRPIMAAVAFDAKKGIKTYLHPQTGVFIREDPMQPADWQLPMFKPADDGSEQPAAPGAPDVAKGKKGKAPKSSPVGATNVGDALDAAAGKTKAPQFALDLTDEAAWNDVSLTKAFKKHAKQAGWSPAQISALNDVLRACDTVEKMIETLRPYTVKPQIAEVDIGSGQIVVVPKLGLTLEPGFTADKYRTQFGKAARAAKWPSKVIDEVDNEALTLAAEVLDEPEAGARVLEYLAKYILA